MNITVIINTAKFLSYRKIHILNDFTATAKVKQCLILAGIGMASAVFSIYPHLLNPPAEGE